MLRRSLTVLSAAAVVSAGLAGVAPSAFATTTCNTTSGGALDGTTICYTTNGVIAGYIPVPYSVGSVCVAGVCTPAQSGTIDVPVVNGNALVVHGTLCVEYKSIRTCRNFSTELGPIHIF